MKTKTLSFLIVLWSDRIKAFQPLHRGQHVGCRSSSSTAVALQASQQPYEEDIERLMSDYQKLQKRLWTDIRQIHRMDALKDLEGMMEKAVDMTALKRFQQEERLMEAEKLEASAASKVDYAQQLKEKATKERKWAQDESALVESIEDGYEDLERLRDMSVAHAASQVEKDANEMSFDGTFEGFVAKINRMQAEDLLIMLHRKEKKLKETLKQIRQMEGEQAMKEWAKQELPHHEDVISAAKKHHKLIDHDPTKGDVAF